MRILLLICFYFRQLVFESLYVSFVVRRWQGDIQTPKYKISLTTNRGLVAEDHARPTSSQAGEQIRHEIKVDLTTAAYTLETSARLLPAQSFE